VQAAVLALAVLLGSPTAAHRSWKPGSYGGLTVGTSSESDARAAFGSPVWTGPYLFDDGDETTNFLVLEYEEAGGMEGRTSVIVHRGTRRIEAILLYSKDESLDHATAWLGTNYVAHGDRNGPCDLTAGAPPDARSVVFYAYPEKGAYIMAQEGRVREIGFIACSGSQPFAVHSHALAGAP